MADRIRSYNWAGTSLGPISDWPEALITTVNLMLFSPFSFAIFWGEEHVLLYNDLYRPFLSDKHPRALGSRGSKVWAEAWEIISEPIRAAFEKGLSSGARRAYIPILIDGSMQDRWWTYGLNPIFDGEEIAGVANSVSDETSTVLTERALRESREELNVGMEAGGLGMWHYDAKTGNVVADERMHRIFGSPAPNGIVDYWLDLLHPDDRERVGTHFRGALAGEHRYDIEYRILRDGQERWLRSKGNVLGAEEGSDRLFAIIEDVTERKRTEAVLQQHEKLAAVGKLATTIAHEINNPLESVTNLLYLIRGSQTLEAVNAFTS